jgi:hypothetical protein
MFYFGISISEPNPNRKYNPKRQNNETLVKYSMSLEMPEIDSKGCIPCSYAFLYVRTRT